MRGVSIPQALVLGLIAVAAGAVLGGPSASADGSSVSAVALGDRHSCLVMTGGGVTCWGSNSAGQLGDGTSGNIRSSPAGVSGLSSGVSAVRGGFDHTCALTTGGGVKCWGANGSGQLGDGTSGNTRTTPVDVAGLGSGVSAIAAGGYHICALMSTGAVKCWGDNFFGQIGDGAPANIRNTPADVSGLSSGVVAIAAGGYHTCALLAAGTVKCWGRNDHGQIGDGTTGENQTTPVDVSIGGATKIAAGNMHTCAITTPGGLKCWGRNSAGQLGTNDSSNRTTPADVTNLTSGVAAVSAGGFHTCAVTTGGGLKCWGRNGDGQLGRGTSGTQEALAGDVSGLTGGVAAVSAGGDHTCALLASGDLKCWGRNADGQVGDGTSGNIHTTPVSVAGLGGDIDGDGLANDVDPDDDNDGCSDLQEQGPNVTLGGQRDPKDVWDFYDTPAAANVRDRAITINDIVRVVGRFGTTGDAGGNPLTQPPPSGYHTAFDRRAAGNNLSGPADGRISIGDIVLAVAQFGHTCA